MKDNKKTQRDIKHEAIMVAQVFIVLVGLLVMYWLVLAMLVMGGFLRG